MLHWTKCARKRALGIPQHQTSFARRGFTAGHPGTRRRLEQVGQTFVAGYHAALRDDGMDDLARRLNEFEPEQRGFAFEGAAMALTLLDHLSVFYRQRVRMFLAGPGEEHIYMVHVGVGWALARLHRRLAVPPSSLDPLLGWLAFDGYGFHEGYFHWRRYVRKQHIRGRLVGYAARAFDQGLGRSLWFVEAGDSLRIQATIDRFQPHRRADLWSGVGLASSYAGGADETELRTLRAVAGPFLPQLAQGAAFAAKARQRAGNPASHTGRACELFCGRHAEEAAQAVDTAMEKLPVDGPLPAYEVWRQRTQTMFASEMVPVC